MGIQDLTFDDLPEVGKRKGASALSFDDVPSKPEDPGAMKAGLIGFGRMSDKIFQGVKQASLGAQSLLPNAIGEAAKLELDRMKQEQQFRDEGYAPLQEQHPIATMAGEVGPLLPLPMGGSVRAAMGISALPGLVEYGSPEEKLARGGAGAIGGAAGYGVGKLIGAAASPGMKATSPEVERLARAAAAEGIPLDAAQVTGNQVLQNAKAALGRIPWTATGQQAKAAEQQGAYNAAILRRLNTGARAATPDVMADAFSATVNKIQDAANSVALTADDKFVSDIASVEKTFLRRLPTDQKPIIQSYLDDLTEIIGKEGALPGDVYNKTRSELGKIAANTSNNTVREGAKGLQKALDSMFDRQAPKEAVTAMKQARSEYSKYLTTAEALKKGRSTTGDIPPKQMYAQAQQDIPGFERGGGGDFNDLVRAGRQFLPDPVPNSGTPERLLYQNLLTAGTLSGMGALGGAFMSDETGKNNAIPGAVLGLGGFGLSKGAQALLNSPALTKYLMSELLTEQEKRLLAQSGGLLGLGYASGVSP